MLFYEVVNLIGRIRRSLVAELQRLDHVERALLVFLEMLIIK